MCKQKPLFNPLLKEQTGAELSIIYYLLPFGYDTIHCAISCAPIYDAIYNICVFITIVMFH